MRDVASATFHYRIDYPYHFLLNVSENNIVMLAFNCFFVVILFENRIPLPDYPGYLEECISEIFGTFFRRDAMLGLVFSRLIHSAVDAAERNKTVC